MASRVLTYDVCIALTDEELQLSTFAAARSLGDARCDEVSSIQGDLYFLLSETFERFAPHVATADLREICEDEPEELEAFLAGIRERQAARLLRDAVGSEGGTSHG